MNARDQKQSSAAPLPLVTFALASGYGYGAYYLYSIGGQQPIARWFALLLGVAAVANTLRTLNEWDRVCDARRLKRQFKRFSKTHGKARLGTRRDAQQQGLTGHRGLPLGALEGTGLVYAGGNSGQLFGPPGCGKGTKQIIPILLSDEAAAPDEHGWSRSFVVTDPKGELYAVTAAAQAALGREVVALCPYWEKMSRELGIPIVDTPYNPLGFLDPNSREVKDDADLAAMLMLPGSPPEKTTSHEKFFISKGQIILATEELDELSEAGEVTLPRMRQRLMISGDAMTRHLATMCANDAFGGVIQEYGEMLSAMYTDAPEQFQGCLASALEAVSIYDSYGPLGQHVSQHKCDFRQGKVRPTVYYLMLPTDRGETHAPWMNLVLSTAFELIGRDRTNRCVTFLIDECANLGYLPNLLRALSLYRAQGEMIFATWQSTSQAERLYGKTGLKEILGQSDVLQFFDVREWEDLRRVSDLLGTTTVADGSQNLRPNRDDGEHLEVSYAGSFRSQPLMRPEEIRLLSSDKQILFYRNAVPFIADKVDYRSHPKWRRRAQPNPYYDRR